MKTAKLWELLDRRALRKLSGEQSYERGEHNFAERISKIRDHLIGKPMG